MKTVIVNTRGYWTLQKQLNRFSCGYFLASDTLSRGVVGRSTQKAAAVVHCEQSLAHIIGCSRCHRRASKTHSLFPLSYSFGSFAAVGGKQRPGSIHHVSGRQFRGGGSVKIHQQQAPQKKTSGSGSGCPQSRDWLAPSNKERGCVFVGHGKTKYWTAAH